MRTPLIPPARSNRARAQRAVQLLSLGAFAALVVLGKNHLWMLLFAASALLSMVFGRFYCGWLCPIQTASSAADGLTRKAGFQKRPIPSWLRHPAVRIAALAAFLLALAFTIIAGRRLPLLPALLAVATMLTLVFPASLWHRFLCPFGAILSATGALARRFLQVDLEQCTGCAVCVDICPGGAAALEDQMRMAIDKRSCLQCSECQSRCPNEAIHF